MSKPRRFTTGQNEDVLPVPDKLYTCVGKGSNGAILEYRHGLEARIGLIADYEQPILRAWSLPSSIHLNGSPDESLFLLSCVESSVVLCMSKDELSIEVIDNVLIDLDFKSETIAFSTVDACTIQVTKESIVVIDGPRRYVFPSLLTSLTDFEVDVCMGKTSS